MAQQAYDRTEELLAEGEGQRVEFRRLPLDAEPEQSMAKTLVAFANSRGGTIMVGVEPDGRVVGVEGNWVEQRLLRIARERTLPAVRIHVRQAELRGKTVYLVMVPPSPLRPHRLASNLMEYVREGRVVCEASAPPLLRLVKLDRVEPLSG